MAGFDELFPDLLILPLTVGRARRHDESGAAAPAVEFEGRDACVFATAYGKNADEVIPVALPKDVSLTDAATTLTGTMYSVPESDAKYPVLLVVKEAKPVKTK